MGLSSSKRVSPHLNHLRDSVMLCDGLTPLRRPFYTATSDGRFIFVIGSRHSTAADRQGDDQAEDDWEESHAKSCKLDIIDMFLSKRTRIESIGDFYYFGEVVGFYALDERTVVLVDCGQFEDNVYLLRQRLLHIDLVNETVECRVYRNYSVLLQLYYFDGNIEYNVKTTIGEECAVTIDEDDRGIVYPLDPLSPKVHTNISTLIEGANAHVHQSYEEDRRAHLSDAHAPFFISNTVLGFFINLDGSIYPMQVLAMDLGTGSFALLKCESAVSFPLSADNSLPDYAEWNQTGNGEVAFISRFHRTGRGWQMVAADMLNRLESRAGQAGQYFFFRRNCERLGDLLFRVGYDLDDRRWRLLNPKTAQFTRFGTFNPRTLKWNEIKVAGWNAGDMGVIPLRGGQFIVPSRTNRVGSDHLIGVKKFAQKEMEQFRLIGNPLRIPSLTHLAMLAVQKHHQEATVLLEQIAARIC